MKISIITVVYNNAATIESAIRSVNGQTYPDVEHIIVDGASTDGTLDIIRANEIFISRSVSERDNGIYDAMNKGIQLATGDVIGILNSDDLYQDDLVLTDVMNCFNSDPSPDIVYGDLHYVKREDITKVVRNWVSMPYYERFFENGNVPPHPSLFVKADVYKKAGLFRTDFRLTADYEFMLRILRKHKFNSRYINRVMVKMRLGGATNKNIRNIIRGNMDILKSWKVNGLTAPLYLMPARMMKRVSQFIFKPKS